MGIKICPKQAFLLKNWSELQLLKKKQEMKASWGGGRLLRLLKSLWWVDHVTTRVGAFSSSFNPFLQTDLNFWAQNEHFYWLAFLSVHFMNKWKGNPQVSYEQLLVTSNKSNTIAMVVSLPTLTSYIHDFSWCSIKEILESFNNMTRLQSLHTFYICILVQDTLWG